jgi:ankyrin repeat protein
MSNGPYKQASSSRLLAIAAGCLAVLTGCSSDVPVIDSASSPILEAVLGADAGAVRDLIARGADVNAAEADGTTLLMRAVHGGNAEIAQALIDAGADVAAVNRYGVHALYLAARAADAAAAHVLLAAGADANATLPEGETVLMTAAKAGSTEVVRALLGPPARYQSNASAASSGYSAVVPAAVYPSRADPNGKETWHGQTALMWAAAEGHSEIVRLLLEAGANPNERSAPRAEPPLGGEATADGTAEPLLTQGRLTALHFAARANEVESARALIEGGADVAAADQLGNTALHFAAAHGSTALIELLAESGANVAAQNELGQSALDIALATPGSAPNEAAAALLQRLQRRGS